jgi:hypothetical protein
VRLCHHEAHRILEDEPEEDADEDDQKCVADGSERAHEPDRSDDDQQGPHRQQKLDAPRVGSLHGAEGYAAKRLDSRSDALG